MHICGRKKCPYQTNAKNKSNIAYFRINKRLNRRICGILRVVSVIHQQIGANAHYAPEKEDTNQVIGGKKAQHRANKDIHKGIMSYTFILAHHISVKEEIGNQSRPHDHHREQKSCICDTQR